MKNAIKIIISILCAAILFANNDPIVKTGIEVLRENNFNILKNKNVGLITNPTGVDSKLKSTIDILNQAKNVNLIAMYAPEHGVRGDYTAGEHVNTYIDRATGVTVYSLYGKHRKPSPEMLKNIDVLIYDIQDTGCRSYTYISTMGYAMAAAAENNIKFVVLDRPNPLNGNRVEGNIVEDGYFSMVSAFPIPYVYGLTCGELAKMLNEENMLPDNIKCDLSIVPMKNWNRNMSFADTKLPWVPSSPHIPHKYSPFYYVASGIIGELGIFNIGVGYTLPFQIYSAKWINPYKLAEEMNKLKLPGVIFRPITFKPYYYHLKGEKLGGVQIHIVDYSKVNLMSMQFHFLEIVHKLYPNKGLFSEAKKRHKMFDKVCGTDKIRKKFSKNYKFKDVKPFLEKDVEEFREKSKKYYLYK
ncbi:MAG: DUF1343 domain-containing protein [Candidatus Marinimicrobia bacterium]|nr:DUF1343 domain-containing protein [Candidatus Neomarinimicrobiota bacterium]